MDEREKMARGLLYDANHNPDLIKERAMCKDMCFAYNSLRPSDEEGKRKIAERLFGRIGKAFSVLAPFYCDYGYNIFCGDDFFANHNCVMLDGAKITFGEHVYIAPNCCFATAGHPLDAGQRAAGLEFAREIRVGNNVWCRRNGAARGNYRRQYGYRCRKHSEQRYSGECCGGGKPVPGIARNYRAGPAILGRAGKSFSAKGR